MGAGTELVPAESPPAGSLDAFLASFVLPLVRGGPVHVGAPLKPGQVATWIGEIDQHASWANAIDEARRGVVAELVVRPPALVFGAEELQLAAGVYNALAMAHPRTAGARRSIRERIHATAVGWLRLPSPASRAEVLGRHAMFHGLFALTRLDTRLTWWSGVAEFRGEESPHRLEYLPRLRRVRKQTEVLRFHELLLTERDLPEDAVLALLASSPLTDLFTASRPHPPFFWSAGTVMLLRDTELARAAAYRFAGDGGEEDPPEEALRAAAAYGRFVKTSSVPEDVRTVTAFLLHMIALWTLGQRNPTVLPPALASLEGEAGEARDPGAAILCALPEALAQVDGRLAVPPGMEEGEWQTRWNRWRPWARRLAAAEVAQLVRSLRRSLARSV